ncbi:MAG TPA: cupin domain-containing protein [Gemmatimonadales bacterium]|nr:cupin domain-containing protein [Gemmatimonadales bacterium]
MRTFNLILGALALVSSAGRAAAQSSDGTVTVVETDRVKAAFAKGTPLIEVRDYKIHASRREGPGVAEIHTRDTDIAYILQGSAVLVTGGTVPDAKEIAPEELRAPTIQGGQTRQVVVGDVVVIPNGVPHWFKEVKAPFLYYVVKVRQAERETAAGAM